MAEEEYNERDSEQYLGWWPPPAPGVDRPALLGFRMYLEHSKIGEHVNRYSMFLAEDGAVTLIDLLIVWLTYGDGIRWCPTHESFLRAVIEITADWLAHDRVTVEHERALLKGRDGIDSVPHARDLAQYVLSPHDRIAFAPRGKLALLISEETFDRIKMAFTL